MLKACLPSEQAIRRCQEYIKRNPAGTGPEQGTDCRRQGKEFEQSYQQGKPITELSQTALPKKAAKQTGTQIRFLYDKKGFSKG